MNVFAGILEDSVLSKESVGISARITHRGRDLFRGAAGYADKENNAPLTCDNLFRVFSNTKLITGVAALMLFDKGCFALDEPVSKYVPVFKDLKVITYTGDGQLAFRAASTPVTMRHLFTMTAGFSYHIPVAIFNAPRHFEDARALSAKILEDATNIPNLTSEKMIEAIASIPMAFEPGTEWMYGLSADIIAAVCEAITKKSFGQFLQDELFNPLGMKDTCHRPNPQQLARLATMYDYSDLQNIVPYDTNEFNIAHRPGSTNEHFVGALHSTLDDFSVFLQMLANEGVHEGKRLISNNTLKLMATDHLNEQQYAVLKKTRFVTGSASWGLMCRVTTNLVGNIPHLMPGSYGWGGWAGTQAAVDPANGLTITMMVQRVPSSSYIVMSKLMQAAYAMI